MSGLSFHGVSKGFAKIAVLKNISMDIAQGEFVAIVGPSGSGKSTTLRLVAGLEEPTSGTISLRGKNLQGCTPVDRNVGMVFQNYALYPHMTVFQNLSFGLESRGVSKRQITEQVEEIAELLEISHLLKRRPRELSGGQKQRVALGRALVRQPDIFLMDEPLSNLDTQLRERMRMEIRQLHKKMAVTTLYVTHDQTEAMTMADRIVVINEGTIEQIGTPHEIYHSPLSTFVASFFGAPAMNLCRVSTQTSTIRPWTGQGSPSDSVAIVGFRPEKMMWTASTNALDLQVTVKEVESLGPRSHVHLLWGETPLVMVSEAEFVPRPGESVTCFVDRGDLHWFDAKTLRRISTDGNVPAQAVVS